MSSAASSIMVRRSSPYFCTMSFSSWEMMAMRRARSARMSLRSAMVRSSSRYSFSILSRSRPVSLRRVISRMASLWRSDSPNCDMRPALAAAASSEPRMSRMISSIWSRAMRRPSRICARSSALPRSKRVRRSTTSWRWSMKWLMSSRRFRVLGRPSTRARLWMEKVSWSWVCLYSRLRMMSGKASFLSSMMMLIPSLSLSSRRSEMPSMTLSRTREAIFSSRLLLLTW